MSRSAARYEMDMTSGPILPNMIRFAIPLMLSSLLQLMYNAADMVVVGRFAGATSLAAVGATSAITSLLVNLFLGLSVGANVTVAQHYGAGRQLDVTQSVQTTVTLSLAGGLVIGILGIVLARPLLTMMATPEDVIDHSALYMRIYFAGMPANLSYNFCAAILRAVGDTKRPLYYLTISGLVNVLLNLLFVIVFKMGVAGVALATIISQIISMALVMNCLIRSDSSVRLNLKQLRLHRDKALQILRVGLPAGLQSSMFSISNTLIQSSINSFGSAAMAGNTAASNIESFVSTPLTAFYQASISFTSQNYGARKPERISRIAWCGVLLVVSLGLTLGRLVLFFGSNLLGIYTADPAVIEWGLGRMRIMGWLSFVNATSNIFVGIMRGMGKSLFPMIVSIMCICVFRVVWILTVFAAFPTQTVLYVSYPISWALSAVIQFTCFMIHKKKVVRQMTAETAAAQI